MKADEMERCSAIWWVLDKKKQTAAWIHGFHLRDSDSWHPSRGSQWSHNYRDVVRPRWERNVEIYHISSHSWGIGTWGLPGSTKDIWKRPLELMPRVEILSERDSVSPQGLNTNICPRINHLLVRLSLFPHLFILPLLKCSLVQLLLPVSGLLRATRVQKLFNRWLHISVEREELLICVPVQTDLNL